MRPLPMPKKTCKPLLQRMAEDKAAQMEKSSLNGSQFFMVQMADGSYEKRLKVPVNADPGVHSSFDLDEVLKKSLQVDKLRRRLNIQFYMKRQQQQATSSGAGKAVAETSLTENNKESEPKESDKLMSEEGIESRELKCNLFQVENCVLLRRRIGIETAQYWQQG